MAWCCGSAGARSGSRDLLSVALGARLDERALAFYRIDRAGVDIVHIAADRAPVNIVDIAPDLQLAGIVHEGGLIGEMNTDLRGLQLYVLLASAEHAGHPLRRPALVGARNVK